MFLFRKHATNVILTPSSRNPGPGDDLIIQVRRFGKGRMKKSDKEPQKWDVRELLLVIMWSRAGDISPVPPVCSSC